MTKDLYSRHSLLAWLILGALVLVAASVPLLLLPLLFVLMLALRDTRNRAPALALARPRRGIALSSLDRGPPRS